MNPDFWNDFVRLITLQDANTRLVLLGTVILGIAAGIIGCFSMLRKRALIGDALSHAALPGICIAFMIVGNKNTFSLLIGAAIAGTIGVLAITVIRSLKRIPEDAAIGIVLSTFFGLGIALSSYIQQTSVGNISGIDTFIYGKAAAMLNEDVKLISAVSLISISIALLCYKEFLLICFDREFASAAGWATTKIDLLLMSLIVVVVIVGLQAVGLVLIIALLITPAATARLWTDKLRVMIWLSALFGGASGLIGTVISALLPKLPTGPIIVMSAASFFILSFLFAPKRGVIAKAISLHRREQSTTLEQFMRIVFENIENKSEKHLYFSAKEIVQLYNGQELKFKKALKMAKKQALIKQQNVKDSFELTPKGFGYAKDIVRRHRLWELFLISEASISPSHADISADTIEHALNPEILERLEEELQSTHPELSDSIPPSPHSLEEVS